MIDKQKRLVTAEAVRRGHPDKLCDQIADAILDAHLSYDSNARVAVEVMATAGSITVAGEVTSRADVNYEKTVLDVIQQIGYKWADLCEEEHDDLDIHIAVHEQSPDIAAAVDGRHPDSDLGAGDQGIMVGYATNETFSMMPRAFVIAQHICRLLDEEAAHTPWLGVDGKAQVSLEYEGDRVTVHDTICAQVANRHEHLEAFARAHDLLLFVAGESSSNGRVLFDLCRRVNPRSYRIGSVSDIDSSWIQEGDSVGICGATSTPKWLLEQVAEAVREA